MAKEVSAEATIRDMKRKTQRKHSAKEKPRLAIEVLRARYRHAVDTGRATAHRKRAKLERPLVERTGSHPAGSPIAPYLFGSGGQS